MFFLRLFSFFLSFFLFCLLAPVFVQVVTQQSLKAERSEKMLSLVHIAAHPWEKIPPALPPRLHPAYNQCWFGNCARSKLLAKKKNTRSSIHSVDTSPPNVNKIKA
jgi:hypothetical protein